MRRAKLSVFRSASDELDNLQPVSVVQWSLRPLVAGHDLAVQFDRHAVGLHAEPFDERTQSFCGRDLSFAIDRQVHRFNCRISAGSSILRQPRTAPKGH